jgi:hypothetical protein
MPEEKCSLLVPIKTGDKTIKEVTVHPLKGKDMVAAASEVGVNFKKEWSQATEMERTICLISKAVDLPVADIMEMDMRDITVIQAHDFLSPPSTSEE